MPNATLSVAFFPGAIGAVRFPATVTTLAEEAWLVTLNTIVPTGMLVLERLTFAFASVTTTGVASARAAVLTVPSTSPATSMQRPTAATSVFLPRRGNVRPG